MQNLPRIHCRSESGYGRVCNADPYIIGVSSGASVGAALAILLGLGSLGLMFSAFFCSILAVYVVYQLGKDSTYALLLAGVAMATFLSGLTSLLVYISTESMHEIVFWIMGGFWTAKWIKVKMILFPAEFLEDECPSTRRRTCYECGD